MASLARFCPRSTERRIAAAPRKSRGSEPGHERGSLIQRTTFSTSRLLEFCSRKELVAQTGHEPDDWPLVILKELIDNALDACEEAGIAPVIRVTVARGKIRVRDNGPGIPPETVASILDFTTRTSSREAYVAPDRGRQGNALKTILAMPFALSGDEGRVEIVARGIRHEITFRVDRIAQRPVIDHRQHGPASVRNGTAVTVHWPESASSDLEDAGARFLTTRRAVRRSESAPEPVRHLGRWGAARALGASRRSTRLAEVVAIDADLSALVSGRRARAPGRRVPVP